MNVNRRREHPPVPGLQAAIVVLGMGFADAALAEPVVESPAPRHANFDTGYLLPRDSLVLEFGSHQTGPDKGDGTGIQLYHGGVDRRGSGRLQFGIDAQVFDDPPVSAIGGSLDNVTLANVGAHLKVLLRSDARMDLAALAGLEYFGIEPDATAGDDWIHGAAATLKLPASFRVGPDLRLHLVPGVTVFPDRLEGYEFLGTNVHMGVGATWQPGPRLQAYGGVTASVGPGGNTLDADGEIERRPVWTAGFRYAVTPRVALDVFATNGLGMSPATDLVTLFPGGDEALFGLKLSYAPGARGEVRAAYGVDAPSPVTPRDRQLARAGFTLSSADTLSPGQGQLGLGAGSDDNAALALRFSPDHAIQIEALIEDYADDGSVGPDRNPSQDARYMFGGRLQFLDRNNGDAFSLSAGLLAGRDVERPTTGVLFADLAASRDIGAATAVTINPRFAVFGDEEIGGLGLGINHAFGPNWQVIGEVTPVSGGEDAVWAAGARYAFDAAPASLDLFATNAIGRHGLGTLVAQDSARIGVGVSFESRLFRR